MTYRYDSNKIRTLAHRAARSVQSRFGSLEVSARGLIDMEQGAAVAIWKALRQGKSDASAFNAGRHAAARWRWKRRGIGTQHIGARTARTLRAENVQEDGQGFEREEVHEERLEQTDDTWQALARARGIE